MVVKRGPVLIPLDRNPLELFLLGWAGIAGVVGVVGVVAGIPPLDSSRSDWWLDLLWYALLATGALTALLGAFWPDAIAGVLIIRAGLLPAGAGGAIYAIALAAEEQLRIAMIIGTFAVACLWRVVQISRHVRAEMGKPRVRIEPPRPSTPE